MHFVAWKVTSNSLNLLMIDYKLTNEDSIGNVQKWKRIKSSCVVSFHEAFTTKAFEDDCTFESAPC